MFHCLLLPNSHAILPIIFIFLLTSVETYIVNGTTTHCLDPNLQEIVQEALRKYDNVDFMTQYIKKALLDPDGIWYKRFAAYTSPPKWLISVTKFHRMNRTDVVHLDDFLSYCSVTDTAREIDVSVIGLAI